MMKAIILNKAEGKPGAVYHPVPLTQIQIPVPGPGEVLVKVIAAAFNHRDIFIRQSLYPGIIFSTDTVPSILGADAVATVISPNSSLVNQTVLLSPMVNWDTSPLGPDGSPSEPFGILGAVKQTGGSGTFAEYMIIKESNLIPCPPHFLTRGREGFAEAAAVPLAALTAYRAVFTKGLVEKGQNVFITGIGGGVAIMALQFCLAVGAKVWVSSSSPEKIARAVKMGAQGGVNYRDKDWSKELGTLLPKDRNYLDCVIDSGGGGIVASVTRSLKHGGIVACYGSTSGVDASVGMGAILKNIEFKGCTMGSLEELKKAIALIALHEIKPVVHTLLNGLEEAETGFEIMKAGGQFGKIVIYVEVGDKRKL